MTPPANPMGWSSQMRDEISRMPETAANIRTASENLKRVSEELITVSAMLHRITEMMERTGVTAGIERTQRVAEELDGIKQMLRPPANLDEAARKMDDVVSGLRGMAERAMGGSRSPDKDA